MTHERKGRVAILYPGDEEARRSATPANNRFAPLFSAFTADGIHAEPAVYHDTFCDVVREQLLQAGATVACSMRCSARWRRPGYSSAPTSSRRDLPQARQGC